MPKSPCSSTPSPNPQNQEEGSSNRQSEIDLRKKKNADAQAAFRARRANYIATLEETVTSLESVVLQMQDSWRESQAELQDVRQKFLRLQHQFRERDRFWRYFCENRKVGPTTPDTDEMSSPLVSPLHAHPSALSPPVASHLAPYTLEANVYRSSAETPIPQSAYSGQQEFTTTGNPLSFHESEVTGDGSHYIGQRNEKMTYAPRPTIDDSKLGLGGYQTTSFTFNTDRFPDNRPLSPISATPSSSMPSTSYQYTFPDAAHTHDAFRRPSQNVEMTLYGGTADISVMPVTDMTRYRPGPRQPISIPERPVLPLVRPGSTNESRHERGSDGDCTSYPRSRRRKTTSRRSSPAAPTVSCTVAVIKAQSFGILRRTRAQMKKSTETAARVALDTLEARGIDLGPKQRESEDDDIDPVQHTD